MRIELPAGATPGSILAITWPPSNTGRITAGTFDAKFIGIKGDRITVHLAYSPSVTLALLRSQISLATNNWW